MINRGPRSALRFGGDDIEEVGVFICKAPLKLQHRKAFSNLPIERIADIAVGIHAAITAALYSRRVHRGPIFDFDGQMAGIFQRAVVGLRGEGDDKVEAIIF